MNTKRISLITLIALAILAGCSSAPKRPPEIFTNRNAAMGQLDLGNRTVSKGDYESAHLFLQEAWRMAVSTDDPETRIRVRLAEGNAWFNEGKLDLSDNAWTTALTEATDAKNKMLISTCKIYLARGTLAEGTNRESLPSAERQQRARDAKAVTVAEMGNVKANPLYSAFAWKVIGLSEKELGNWADAEKALKEAAAIHERDRYLEDAAYDWYLIASVRSKAAQYPSAIAALQTAITFDRRGENSNGLGMNWMAIGTIEEKAGNRDLALAAYQRSADIFRSAFLPVNAAEADQKAAALSAK